MDALLTTAKRWAHAHAYCQDPAAGPPLASEACVVTTRPPSSDSLKASISMEMDRLPKGARNKLAEESIESKLATLKGHCETATNMLGRVQPDRRKQYKL
jgi:hypothetical protein